MKAFSALITLIIIPVCLYSQIRYEIRGSLRDSMGRGIVGASVKLNSAVDTLASKTNDDGSFIISGVEGLRFTLVVTVLGYKNIEREYMLDKNKHFYILQPIILESTSYELDQISIMAKRAVIIKKDTIEYQARNFKVRENAFTEELLRKLPGLSFDRDGILSAQGKVVTRVTVNGKDFFGGDVETAIKNIPASLIEKIQVIDDYGERGRLTGTSSGFYQRVINIKTWANIRKGYFANAGAGAGTEERYQVSGMANYFDNNRETAAYANLNNNNSKIPNAEYSVGEPRTGLNTLSSAGFNYRERSSRHLNTYGNYVFTSNLNRRISETFRRNVYPDNNSILNQDTTRSRSRLFSHVLQWNVEYDDSVTYVLFSPSFNYNKREGESSVNMKQSRQMASFITDSLHQMTLDRSNSSAPLAAARLLVNHKFDNHGRMLFSEFNFRGGGSKQRQDVNALMRYYDRYGRPGPDSVQRQILDNESESFSGLARFVYVEPISRHSRVEVGYTLSHANYNNDRDTRINIFRRVDSLSNEYEYSFTTNTVKLAFKHAGSKHSYTLGLSLQPTLLSGKSINDFSELNRRNLNFFPEVNYSFHISTEKTLNAIYSASPNAPSYFQLQPVTDLTNPQYPVTGNPTLKSELNHSIDINYNSFDINTGTTFFAGINGSYAQDQVVSNTILIQRDENIVSQETRFANVNGSYNVGGLYNLSLPFSERRYVLDLNGSINYNHNLSLSNNEEISSRNLIMSQAIRMQINPGDFLELYPTVIYTYNRNAYSLEQNNISELSSWTLAASCRWNILKSFSLGMELDKSFNIGFLGSGRTNPFIINTYIEKQFFKHRRGALRLGGFDLLDQNTSVQRSIINNAKLDNKSNKLGRYFMLLFTFNINKFEA